MTSLSDPEIRALYATFDEGRPLGWEAWIKRATESFTTAQALTEADLQSPEAMRALWTDHALASAGQASNIDVTVLLGDELMVSQLRGLRFGALPPDPTPRALRLRELHLQLIERVRALIPRYAPMSRLRRVMMLLRPRDCIAVLKDDAVRSVNQAIGRRGVIDPIEVGSLARARLREVLGPEQDLRDDAVRAVFCWWLHWRDHQTSADTATTTSPEISAQDVNIDEPAPAPEAPTWTGERIYQLWQSAEAQAEFCRGLADATISTYRQPVNTVLNALRASHGDRAVDLESDVLNAIAQQWGRGATAQTVNGYRLQWNRWVGVANTRGLPLRQLSADPLPPSGPAPRPAPTLAELRALFQNDAQTANLIFPPELSRGLFAAWSFHARKRFVLLSGLSGTGKTELLKHTARLTCAHMGLDPVEHVALVAVAPDWRDPTGLLGYPSALHAEPTYHKTLALQLLLRAAEDPERPYFLLLDEMNLARVERYFAPFLSAMESGADLHLHGENGAINGVPPSVPWPKNLRIGGTVNMDETTYPFSDKVLDRAFTFELWQVDLDALFAQRGQDGPTEARTQAALRALQAHLLPIRRHVGYRALSEALDWVAACHEADPEAPIAGLIDEAVFAKVLPRLRGSESSGLTAALAQIAESSGQHGLERCKEKVEAMAERLRDSGVTSFWS